MNARAPRHVVQRYLNGGCVAFAIGLKRELSLQLYALVDKSSGIEEWHHVFAADDDESFAVDVRGILPFDAAEIASGSRAGPDVSIRKTTMKEAQERTERYPTVNEINEARSNVRRYFTVVVENALAAAVNCRL